MLLGRFGGTQLSRNTLAASVVRVGQAVQPAVNMLRDALLDSFIVHGDETEVQVLKEPGRKAQAKSYMWVQMTEASGAEGTGPPIRLFGYPCGFASRFGDDCRGTNPEELLGAAHAACFMMSFSFACEKAGFATAAIDTQRHVRLASLRLQKFSN